MPTWDRHVPTPDLWPEELIDDITGWFDDLRGRWPDVEWWVQRIHGSSSSSRMTILQQVNYVLITRRDFVSAWEHKKKALRSTANIVALYPPFYAISSQCSALPPANSSPLRSSYKEEAAAARGSSSVRFTGS